MAEVSNTAEANQKVMNELVHEFADLLSKKKNEEAKLMLVRTPRLLNYADDSGRSTVHFAALGGSLELLQVALEGQLEKMADKEDSEGWTPLMIASSAGREDVVHYLLSLTEVDPLHRNRNGQIALHYAASKNHPAIVAMLCEANPEGAFIKDKYGATPLHRAASKGHEGVVNAMLHRSKGRSSASVDMVDGEKKTALHLAVEGGYKDIALILIRFGSDIYLQNQDEKTPLQLTTDRAFIKAMKDTADQISSVY